MDSTIFEKSNASKSSFQGFDSDFTGSVENYFNKSLLRAEALAIPEVPEVEVVRHYTKLSRESHGVDSGTYPLGSCTMKYNPKRNDVMAMLTGFTDVHPMQPVESMSGIWQIFYELQNMIAELMGMDAVTLQPAAGAHGELTGLLIAKAHFENKKQKRKTILIADSAHGTNPASASMAGYICKIIPTSPEGMMDVETLKKMVDSDVAVLMLTNPSTLGLFEERILEISDILHKNGSLLYYDGANMNALMGLVRPGDMGFDIVHINTHKTLSTPHGGGGPGAGPVGVKEFLEPYLPSPVIIKKNDKIVPSYDRPLSIGRVKSFYGHVSVLIRAYCYILTCGPKGLKTTSENAVLNSNYIQARLSEYLPAVFKRLCMHECLLSGHLLSVNSFDFAKRLIDFGVHPPTLVGAGCVYFPGDLKSAMLIEPTETETKESLDQLIKVFIKVIEESKINPQLIESAPHNRIVGKIDFKTLEE
jgi:glycine dehydrogenase subunit 2